MLYFIYCGYACLIYQVLASLHSAAFTLSQVKRHTVSAIDIPALPLPMLISYSCTECAMLLSHPITHSPAVRYLRLNTSVAETQLQSICHIVQYHCILLHYMPHISTLQVVYDVIFLVIMASILCGYLLRECGYGWQYFRCFLCLIQHALPTLLSQASCIIHRTSFYMFLGQPCGGI
jgi:hypothetical protein